MTPLKLQTITATFLLPNISPLQAVLPRILGMKRISCIQREFLFKSQEFSVRFSKVITSNRGRGGFTANPESSLLDELGDIWPDAARGRMRLNDSELYEAIRSGSELRDEAIAQLRELLVRGLSKALTGRYGKPFNAEDVAQETY